MKTKLFIILMVVLLFPGKSIAADVQLDPTLVAAIEKMNKDLKEEYKERHKTQLAIIGAKMTVKASLDKVHEIQNKTLKYLENASVAVQNIYQVQQAVKLVAIQIPNHLAELTKVATANWHNIKGTAMALTVSKQTTEIPMKLASLYPYIKELVTSGTTTDNITKKSHKVNLLNAAERIEIASTILYTLEDIDRDLQILIWTIPYMSWQEFLYQLDSEGWINLLTGIDMVEGIAKQWKWEVQNIKDFDLF